MKQPIRAAVAIALFLTCAFLSATGESDSRKPDLPELLPVTLMLDWVPNVNHVGLYVARDNGFFEAEGLDVSIIETGEVYAPGAVVGGKADFGIDFQESVTLLRADGVPVVSVAAILQSNTSGFAVRSGDAIESPADFAGLTYGTFNSPFEEPTIAALVRCSGGDPSEITFVTAGMDLLAMLDQKQADFVWIYYGTQGFQAERVGVDIRYFPLNEYTSCIPTSYTPVIITSEATVERDPETVRKFLAATAAAHEFVMAQPEMAARILADAVPELDADELAESVPWVARHMKLDAPVWGYQQESVWAGYAEWMRSVGVLSGSFDAAGAFTNDFLPR